MVNQCKEKHITQTPSQKLIFQKCFDKHASVTFQMKYKEIISPVPETITEENEQSRFEEDYEHIETSRLSTLESAREVHLEVESDEQNEELLSNRYSKSASLLNSN